MLAQGPWKIRGYRQFENVVLATITDTEGSVVAQVRGGGTNGAIEDVAMLTSLAPEMLDLIEQTYDRLLGIKDHKLSASEKTFVEGARKIFSKMDM